MRPKKFIEHIDDKWHSILDEGTPTTTNVELLKKDGTIVKATFVVEMSGCDIYLNPGWGAFSDYTHWRFIEEK